jgi:hypothetical protein
MASDNSSHRGVAVVELVVDAPGRTGGRPEPVTCGVPWPRGSLADPGRLALSDSLGQPVALQARTLAKWPDGSVRWVLLDWLAEPGRGPYRLNPSAGASGARPGGVTVEATPAGAVVDTGVARFELGKGGTFPFRTASASGAPALDPERTRFAAEDESGRTFLPRIDSVVVEEPGPVRVLVCLRGELAAPGVPALTDFVARLHFFAGSAVVRFELTLRNPRKAEHPGGLWDLGNGGSVYLRDASLTVALPPGDGASCLRCSPEPGAAFEELATPLELYQDSSGGENWKSSNHLNRKHEIPNTFRGYRLRTAGTERHGLRATPAVCLTRGGAALGLAMPWFWQNFPKAVDADAAAVVLRLFPRQYADVHELQGGEQKTHTFSVVFGHEAGAEQTLEWCRAPARAAATPAWCCSTAAVPSLTPRASDPHPAYLALVDAALEGDDTFERKREVIDEYGWRHFGDLYGDHEAVFHKGPTPLVSHYNNQYDALAGLGYQFLRSGAWRWLQQRDEMAAHVADVDVYHTDRDKSAYNHGLFWHTFHYADADTGTHRSYPARCGTSPPTT